MFPPDRNSPKSIKFRRFTRKPPQYHIKGDPLGHACFPKPQPELKCLPKSTPTEE